MGGIETAAAAKIDSYATLGLAGVHNSLAYRVHEIEKHVHNREYWYGQSGADTFLSNASLTSWVLTAGDSVAYGTPVQLSNGDEIAGGSTTQKYDMHRLLITGTNQADSAYKIQFLYGTGVVGDAAILTEVTFVAPTQSIDGSPVEILSPRITCNNKLWAKLACLTNGKTLAFFIGVHVYEA
jgi:hypothetical protein